MKPGLCTISGNDRPVDEVLEAAGDVGYDGVEIWGKDHVGDGSPATCRRLADAAADHGLEIPAYGSYLRAGTDAFEDHLDREVAVADRLGADLLRVWAGRQEYGDHDGAHWDRVVADLERVLDRATDRGLGVTVEKHEGTLTNTGTGARRLIEAVDHDRCGLNWQPLFSLAAASLEAEAETLAPLSNHVHLQAVRERGGRERCPLSEAYFDLGAVLEPFLAGGFEGYANVEFVTDDRPYREAIAADLAFLLSILE